MAEAISTNQFKNGMHVRVDGIAWRIVEFQHVKPGKGGAFVRTKLKAVDSGKVVERTFRAGETMPRVQTSTEDVQYLYDDGTNYVFMRVENYEQMPLPHAAVADEVAYLKEGDVVQLLSASTTCPPRCSCRPRSSSSSRRPSPASRATRSRT